MYGECYGFQEKPFSLLPDPEFLYPSDKHQRALDLLEMAVLNQSGFCVLSGEIGTGKTTLLRELLNRLDARVRVGLISNTHESFAELFSWILSAFDLEANSDEAIYQHSQFTDFVIEQYARGKHTLLIIDEAQNLSLPALEQLRMLSNINSEKDFVLQIILIGQHELRDKLRQPELAQFVQRIAMDYHLSALDEAETLAYIHHRVTKAGGPANLFTQDACRLVHQYSKGIPRLINKICDLALVYGFAEKARLVDATLIEAVTRDHGSLTGVSTKDTAAQPGPRTVQAAPPIRVTQQSLFASGDHTTQATGGTGVKKTKKSSPKADQRRPSAAPAREAAPIPKALPARETGNALQPAQHIKTTDVTQSPEALRRFVEQAAAEKTLAEKIAAEKTAAAKAAIEAATAELDAAKTAVREKLLAEKQAAEKILAEKQAAKRAAGSKAAADSAVSTRQAAEQAVVLKDDEATQAGNHFAAEKRETDKMVSDCISLEQTVEQEAATAKAAAEKALAERIAAEKAANERAEAADAAVRKALSERVNAEKTAARRLAEAQAAVQRAQAEQAEARKKAEQQRTIEKNAIQQAEKDSAAAQQAAEARLAAKQQEKQHISAAELTSENARRTRAAADRAVADHLAATKAAAEKLTAEKVALAKVAAHSATLAQQAAKQAEAAKSAALNEARKKEAEARAAARIAAEADAAAQQALQAEQHSDSESVDMPAVEDADKSRHPLDDLLIAGNLAIHQTDNQQTHKPGRMWTTVAIAAAAAGAAWLSIEQSGVDLSAKFAALSGTKSGQSGSIAAMEVQDVTQNGKTDDSKQ